MNLTRRFVAYLTRKGRMRPFVLSLVVALLVLPTETAIAFFSATGSGTVSGVQAGSASSTVALSTVGGFTYSGPSTTNLMPGGTVSFTVQATCTASCPATVSTVNLQSWSSNKTGCDSTTLPNSFTMPAITANLSVNTSATTVGTATITWVNLAVNQNACSNASFTFVLTTP